MADDWSAISLALVVGQNSGVTRDVNNNLSLTTPYEALDFSHELMD